MQNQTGCVLQEIAESVFCANNSKITLWKDFEKGTQNQALSVTWILEATKKERERKGELLLSFMNALSMCLFKQHHPFVYLLL